MPDPDPDPDHSASITASLTHFRNHPLAHSTITDPQFTPYFLSRTLTHAGRGHTLMATTLNTAPTISHLLTFFRPAHEHQHRAEVRRFYTFGSGLNAHPDILHGGVVAMVLDSTMGNTAGLVVGDGEGHFTVRLSVEYMRPVRTPGTVVVRAWVVQGGGRKVWVEAVVEGYDEVGEGVVCHAKGEGLWVRARSKGKGTGKL